MKAEGRWRHWLLVGFGLAAGLLLAAWISFPLWAPVAVSAALPDSWKLRELEADRPGWRRLYITRLVLEGRLPGFHLEVEAREVTVALDGTRLEITGLTTRLKPATGSGSSAEDDDRPWSERWSLPRLVPPDGLPGIEIARLEWVFENRGEVQTGVLEDLAFGRDASSVTLETALSPIPMTTRPGLLTIHLSGGSAYVDLLATGEGPRRMFFYRQANIETREAGRGQNATATVQFDLDLAELDPDAIQPFTAPFATASLERAKGVFRGGLQFQGQERLQPLALNLEARGIDLAAGGESIQLEWSINGGLDGTSIALEQELLEADIVVRADRWAHLRAAALNRLGLSGLPAGPATLALSAAGPGRGRIDIRRGLPVAWEGEVALEAEVASTRAGLTVTDGRLNTTEDGSLEFGAGIMTFLQHPDTLRLDHPLLEFALDKPDLALQMSLQWNAGDLQIQDGELTRFTANTVFLATEGLELGIQNGALTGEFAWGRERRFIGPLSGTNLVVGEPGAALPGLRSDRVSGELEATFTDEPLAKGKLRFDGASLPAMDLSMDGMDIEIEHLDLASLAGRLSLLTTGMRVPLFGKETTGFDLDLQSEISEGEPTRGSGELLIGYAATLPFTFRTSSGSGHLVLDLDQSALPASALPTLLRTLEPAWADPLKPGQGELLLDGSIEFLEVDGDFTPSGVLAIDADDLAFCYGKSCIRDLDLHGAWSLGQELSGATSLGIGQAGLAAGLDLSRFQAQIDVASPRRIELHEFSASLLDGRLHSTPFTIENQSLGDVTVSWSEFDLARLFAFLDVSGLEGSGRVDAEFPIDNTDGGLGVSNGRFRANGPGTIRYRAGLPAANIGMQALENFKFDSLDGTIDYRPDGRYDIRVTLDGRNPDLYGGHPVRFNLNIGGELPALFKTLFITGDFGEAILEQIRAGQQDLADPGP